MEEVSRGVRRGGCEEEVTMEAGVGREEVRGGER